MTHALPGWIERLLGLRAVTGRAMEWRVEWSWPWPPWATLLFLVFAAVFVAAIYRREGRRASRAYRGALMAMRLGLIVLAMLMAAQVSLLPQRSEPPRLAILVDDSRSMTLADDANGKLDRWSLLQTLFSENNGDFLRRLAEKYSPRVDFLSDGRTVRGENISRATAAIRAAKPLGEQSRLGAAISAALDRHPDAAAVVALTDGVNTAGPSLAEAAELARRRGVPLWFVGFGGERRPRELRLADLAAEESVFFGDVLMARFRLEASGLEGKKISIIVGERTGSTPLAETEILAPGDGQSRLISLPFRPARPGKVEYFVEATVNGVKSNRLAGEVEVSQEKLSVLMVQAAPSFEFRYLHNLLVRRDDIELRAVLQEADPGHAAQTEGFLAEAPSAREELFAFDVIIIGDANPALLASDTLKNLAEFVERPEKGGGVAMICGPRFMPSAYAQTPLARLMPFAPRGSRTAGENLEQGFRVRPTELGLASPGMQLADTATATLRAWESLPPLYWRWNISQEQLKPAAGLMAVAAAERGSGDAPAPLVCALHIGAGRVLFHATDETWRWRWRRGDEYFARYWLQTIHWLGRAKLAAASVAIDTDQASYRAGEPVRLLVRFRDERLVPAEDDAAAMIGSSDGKPTRVRLRRAAVGKGLFEGLADGLPPGEYRVWLVSPRLPDARPYAVFTVRPPGDELARREADFAAMQAAAALSGGRLVGLDEATRLADELPPGRQAVVERLPPEPLWNRWPFAAVFLGVLIGEWTLRKRRGMA
jgi:hypothetical protein